MPNRPLAACVATDPVKPEVGSQLKLTFLQDVCSHLHTVTSGNFPHRFFVTVIISVKPHTTEVACFHTRFSEAWTHWLRIQPGYRAFTPQGQEALRPG